MRNFLIAVVVIFCVTLAVVIGNRMSTEAMAVVIGVVCGVAASIPMSLLILVVSSRAGRSNDQAMTQGHGSYPPVVVIQGGQPLPAGQGYAPYLPALMHNQGSFQQREFTVVGDEPE